MTLENFKRFENMVTASLFKKYFEIADDSIKHSLLTQYRMHTDIMNIINRFYSNRLKQGLSAKKLETHKNHELEIKGVDGSSFITPQRHAYWIDSSYLPDGTLIEDSHKEGSTSAFNCLETRIILELLRKMAYEYKQKGYASSMLHGLILISKWSDTMTFLNLASIRCCTISEGPGKRFAIWAQGCLNHCPGCCNPQMQPLIKNHIVSVDDLEKLILDSVDTFKIEGVSFIGGEPFLQAKGFAELAKWCRDQGLSVLVFSGYTYDEINTLDIAGSSDLLRYIDVLIDGPL